MLCNVLYTIVVMCNVCWCNAHVCVCVFVCVEAAKEREKERAEEEERTKMARLRKVIEKEKKKRLKDKKPKTKKWYLHHLLCGYGVYCYHSDMVAVLRFVLSSLSTGRRVRTRDSTRSTLRDTTAVLRSLLLVRVKRVRRRDTGRGRGWGRGRGGGGRSTRERKATRNLLELTIVPQMSQPPVTQRRMGRECNRSAREDTEKLKSL